MFREALLESSPMRRKRSHWSMATAFMLELIVGGAVVLVPLISTGVITLKSQAAIIAPPQYIAPRTERPRATQAPGRSSGPAFPRMQVVALVNDGRHLIDPGLKPAIYSNNPDATPSWQTVSGSGDPTSALFDHGQPLVPVKPVRKFIVSQAMEALLEHKVIPEYPQIAKLAGVQGDVKLHAIIAKDGTIQSLTVTSGPTMLITAATDAVKQWRYQPYRLNGEPVEVETVITVSFRRF